MSVSTLRQTAERLASTTFDGAKLGAAFDEHKDRLRKLHGQTARLFEMLSNCDLDTLPGDTVGAFENLASKLDQAMSPVLNAVPEVFQNPLAAVNNWSKAFRDCLNAMGPIIAYRAVENWDRNERLSEMRGQAEAAVKATLAARDAAQAAAAETGAVHFAGVFLRQANKDRHRASFWLGATTVAGFIAFVAAICLFTEYRQLYRDSGKGNGAFFAAAPLAGGVALLSIFFYALVLCGRTYRAHEHNATLNQHRANALQTFQAFAEGAGKDVQAKNAVLMFAAQAIFTPQPTGFTSAKEGEVVGPPAIIGTLPGAVFQKSE